MKTTILLLSMLATHSVLADEVAYNSATDGSATLTIQGDEAKKLFAAMSAVKKDNRQSPFPGFGSVTIKPFSGVECVAAAADRLPTTYTCTVKFYNVANGIPDSR